MSNVNTASQIDEGKLNGFIGQMLGDLGGASSIAMVRMGDALGLYKQLHAKGPMTSVELELPVLRPGIGEVRAAARTGHGIRDRGKPGLPDGRLRSDGGTARQPV